MWVLFEGGLYMRKYGSCKFSCTGGPPISWLLVPNGYPEMRAVAAATSTGGRCIFFTWGHSLNLIGYARVFLRLMRNFFWKLLSINQLSYAYVITQGICNKFIEVNFCVECMVSQPNRLFQHLTTMSLINKMIEIIWFKVWRLWFSWFLNLKLYNSFFIMIHIKEGVKREVSRFRIAIKNKPNQPLRELESEEQPSFCL